MFLLLLIFEAEETIMEIFPKSSVFFWKKAKKMIYYRDISFKLQVSRGKRQAARVSRQSAG